MSEYNNDPSGLYDEEFLKKQEKNNSKTASGEYDIFDLEDIDMLFKERNEAVLAAGEEKEDPSQNRESTAAQEREGAGNVVDVLPPYRRETVERTTEDITELTRKRNHESYEQEISDKPLIDEELYKEPSLGVDIDELLESLGLSIESEMSQEEAEAEMSEKAETVEQKDKQLTEEIKPEAAAETSAQKAAENEAETEKTSKAKTEEDDLQNTQAIGKIEEISEAAQAEPDISSTRHFDISEKKESQKDMGSTRYFNLKSYLKPDKAEAEKKLKASRKNLMQNFRVLSKNKGEDEAILEAIPTGDGKGSMMDNIRAEEGEDLFAAVEKAQKKKSRRTARDDKKNAVISGKAAASELQATLKKQKIQLIALSAVLVVSLLVAFVPAIIASSSEAVANPPSIGIFVLLNIICLFAAVGIAYKYYYSAVLSVYYMAPDADTCVLISAVFVLLHNIITLALSSKIQLADLKMYTAAAVFAVLMRVFSDFLRTSTALKGVKTLIGNDSISCIQPVESRADSAVLAHGLSEDGKPKILYCAETDMSEGVTTDISAIKTEDKYYSYSCLALVVVSLVIGIIFSVKNRDAVSFITALMSCMSISLPVMSDTVASAHSYIQNRKLSKIGGAATSYETIHEIGKSNAVVMDVSDIFVGRVSKFKRVPMSKIAQSDSAVFAAATLKAAGSILSECFDEFIEQMGITLPEAEDFACEEKLGYSCWIADRRVLVGNRQMLIEHSIPAPTEYEEKQYAGKQSVMYVAVEGELTATFVVSYKVLSKARSAARDFASTGLVLMLTSKEPCLQEHAVSVALGLGVTSVKLVSSKGIGIMEKYRENKSMRKSAGVFCSGKSGSLLSLAAVSHGLYTSNRFIFIIHIVSQIIAAVLMLLAVLLNMTAFFNPLVIIVYLLFWSFVCLAFTQKDSIIKLLTKSK